MSEHQVGKSGRGVVSRVGRIGCCIISGKVRYALEGHWCARQGSPGLGFVKYPTGEWQIAVR